MWLIHGGIKGYQEVELGAAEEAERRNVITIIVAVANEAGCWCWGGWRRRRGVRACAPRQRRCWCVLRLGMQAAPAPAPRLLSASDCELRRITRLPVRASLPRLHLLDNNNNNNELNYY